jgi:hypothetical protein
VVIQAVQIRLCEERDLEHFHPFGGPDHLAYCREQFARGSAACTILVATDEKDAPVGKLHLDFETRATAGEAVLLAAAVRRDRQSRGIVSQLMFLVVINIVFGFASNGTIDNAAHLGGLAAGLWIGALVPPTGVPTMSSLWQRAPDPKAGGAGGPSPVAAAGIAQAPGYVLLLALAVIAVVVVAGLAFGTNARLG